MSKKTVQKSQVPLPEEFPSLELVGSVQDNKKGEVQFRGGFNIGPLPLSNTEFPRLGTPQQSQRPQPIPFHHGFDTRQGHEILVPVHMIMPRAIINHPQAFQQPRFQLTPTNYHPSSSRTYYREVTPSMLHHESQQTRPLLFPQGPRMNKVPRGKRNADTVVNSISHSPRDQPSTSRQAKFIQLFYTLVDEPNVARNDLMYCEFQKLALTDQLREFLAALSLTKTAQRNRENVLEDLQTLLRKELSSNCVVYPFGSFKTGLNDLKSDVDIYIDAYGVTKGFHAPKDCSTLDVLNLCHKIVRRAKCLRSNKPFANQVIPIKEARVPILKIKHSLTGVNCDLSFENLISVRNSEMISLYIKLHPVVRPLIVLIRYWGKYYNLTGSNNVKNYGLILLVLVFLGRQNIVPSIETLQKRKQEIRQKSARLNGKLINEDDIIDGWNTGFLDDVQEIKEHFKSSLSLEEAGSNLVGAVLKLSADFFEMYAQMNFVTTAVCSYTSQFLPKSLFSAGNEEDLPDSLDRYKEWCVRQSSDRRLNIKTPLCIQDPFILSYNVGSVTPGPVLLKFQVACSQSARQLRNENIKSLLEIFISLPKEVGDRNFMNMQERQMKTKHLQRDISQFIVHGTHYVPSEEDIETVALHLKPIKEIVDKSTVRYGKGWESFNKFEPDKDFQKNFAEAIKRFRLNERLTPAYLLEKLKLLWISYATDFLREFWGRCFNFTVSREERVEDLRQFADPPFQMKGRKNYEAIFYEKSKKSTKNTPGETDISQEEVDSIRKKVFDLGELNWHVLYQIVHCTAYYPVWQKRERTYAELATDLRWESSQDKRIEDDVSPKARNRKKSKKKSIASTLECDIDPLVIEERITDELLESFKSGNTTEAKSKKKALLKFVSYIKFDCSFVDDLPALYFIFKKEEGSENTYVQGVSTVVDRISEALPKYCLYRLKKWLDLSHTRAAENKKPEHAKGSDAQGSSQSPSLVSTDNYDDSDLLLPPSSSSSSECCFSPSRGPES